MITVKSFLETPYLCGATRTAQGIELFGGYWEMTPEMVEAQSLAKKEKNPHLHIPRLEAVDTRRSYYEPVPASEMSEAWQVREIHPVVVSTESEWDELSGHKPYACYWANSSCLNEYYECYADALRAAIALNVWSERIDGDVIYPQAWDNPSKFFSPVEYSITLEVSKSTESLAKTLLIPSDTRYVAKVTNPMGGGRWVRVYANSNDSQKLELTSCSRVLGSFKTLKEASDCMDEHIQAVGGLDEACAGRYHNYWNILHCDYKKRRGAAYGGR